jgi:hypothetical protein
MLGHEFEDSHSSVETKRRRGRSNAVKRHGARELVQRVAWLSQPLVYWSDAAPTFEPQQQISYRPLTNIIAERLSSLSSGVYAVQIASPQVSVVSVTRITSEHIGTAAAAIGLSKRYPKAMPKLVGDVDAWRAAIERRVQAVGAAVRAAASLGKQRGETLAIEELCLWIGPDALRPSRTLSTEAIHAWLIDTAKTAAPGQRAGAIVLGQRRARCDVPPRLAAWMQVGSTLSRWSPDVICRLLTDERDASQLTQLTRSLLALNSEEVALAALEYHHAAGKNLRAFLAALPPLFSAWDRICEEPRRRWEMVLELIHQAFLAAADAPRRWHHPFNEALARLLRETCETRGLNGKVEEGSPYKHLCNLFQWLLGVPPEWIESLNLKCRLSEFQSQVLALLAKFEQRITTPSDDWKKTAFGLAARIAAVGEPSLVIPPFASWLNHCRHFCVPEHNSEGIVRFAVSHLEKGINSSGGNAANVIRLVETLGMCGDELLKGTIEDDALSTLSRLGALRVEQCRLVINHDLFDHVRHILSHKPAMLAAFMDWVEQRDADWFALHHNYKRKWAELFCLSLERLVAALAEWTVSVVTQDGFSWHNAPSFLDDVLDFCDAKTEGEPADQVQRQEFLLRHLWICQKILRAVQQYMKALPEEGFDDWRDAEGAFYNRIEILTIAYHWHRRGDEDVEGTVDALLQRCARQDEAALKRGDEFAPEYFRDSDPHLAVLMSAGKRERLLNLSEHDMQSWHYREVPLRGWRFLDRYPLVQEFLSKCVERTELIPRVLKLPQRLALAARLPSRELFQTAFAQWSDPSDADVPPLPNIFPPALMSDLKRLMAYQAMTGKPCAVPKVIEEILERPQSLSLERNTLEQREREGALSPSAALRLENLRAYLSDPNRLNEWIADDCAAAIARQMPLAQLDALEHIVRVTIRHHWDSVLGKVEVDLDDPDWDNALRLYYLTDQNKRLLRGLLRQEAKGNRQWIHHYPANQPFIERMKSKGVDVDIWLGAFERTFVINGETWTVYAETNPLKVLQMGNLFGTCLSVGSGGNAFSTIANAVEANKRVLYVQNEKGHVIGRKLILLTSEGALVGCRSYGVIESHYDGYDKGSPWVKILFDLLCLELAQRSGAHLFTREEDAAINYEKEIPLFANWYFDGAESFDWWIATTQTELAHAVLDHLKDSNEADNWSGREATLRALIWLGDDAAPILQEAKNLAYLSDEQLKFISQHAQPVRLRPSP